MKEEDPFGNLNDWGVVLERLETVAVNGNFSQCQAGLIRILRYRGNWRLREEVLKRLGRIEDPSNALIHQVVAVLNDDNLYYDVRIMAGRALMELLKNKGGTEDGDLREKAKTVVWKLRETPQPPLFKEALDRLDSELGIQHPSLKTSV